MTFTSAGSPSQKRWSRAGRGDTSWPEGCRRQNQGPVVGKGRAWGHETATDLPPGAWLG